MSITSSLAAQSAIINRSNAEMASIRASQGIQDLAKSGMDSRAIAQKELQLQLEKEKAELKAKVAKAEEEALKKKKKLDCYA